MGGPPRPAFQAPRGIQTRDQLKAHVLEHGPAGHERNLEIYREWFAQAPRYLFRAVDQRYQFTRGTVCDAGASFGENLVFCHPDSYGIEVRDDRASFARAIGLQCYTRDLISDDLSDLPKVQAVWCSAVLEHVLSPHLFLRKLYGLLAEDGLLLLYVPTVPLLPSLARLPRFGKYFKGSRAADHINFFTPATLRWTCERSGFKTRELSAFYPSPLGVLNALPVARRLLDGCVYVGTKIEGWDYPRNANRRVANNRDGFVPKKAHSAPGDDDEEFVR